MKYREFTKIAKRISAERRIPLDDVEFEVSLYPTETPPIDGVRYFGEIHELMDHQGRVMILCDGERNYPIITVKIKS
jgi:hypothetical protein